MSGADADGTGAVPGLEVKEGGLGSRAQAVALATLCAVLFLTFLDNTIVSVGLANIQGNLHAGVASLQWVVNGYALTFAAFMLAGGTLGDLLGRKKIMLGGVAVFCAGSVIAASASNVDWLIAGRVVMGLGAAASEPGTLSIIRHVYPDKGTRADALGIWAAVSGLALALGPVIGGVLVGISDWRAIFLVQPGLRVRGFRHGARFCTRDIRPTGSPDRRGRHHPRSGEPGQRLFCRHPRRTVRIPHLVDRRSLRLLGPDRGHLRRRRTQGARSDLDLSLFRRPPFAGSNFVAFAAYFGTFSIFFFTALYLQEVGNASAYQTALDFIPMAIALIVASALTGPWVARIGPKIPMTVGCVLAGAGILLTNHLLGPHTDFSTLGWVLPIAGAGFGIALVPVTSTPLTVVPPDRSGMAASATNTSREMGAVFGVAILGAIVNAKLTGQLEHA